MNGPEELQRLRLWQRAYGDTQPTAQRRTNMGLALARYFRALRFRRGEVGDGPLDPVTPVSPVRKIG